MSKLGKILIWVNAFLSFLFLGFASALVYKSGDWKAKHDALDQRTTKEIEEKQALVSKLGVDLDTLKRELGQCQTQHDNLVQEKGSLEDALTQEKTANAQLRGAVDQINANLDNYRASNQSLHDQVAKLQGEIGALRDARDAAVSAQMKAEAERNEAVAAMQKAKNALEELQGGAEQALKDRESLDAKLKAIIKMTGVDATAVQAQPQIDGVVFEVLGEAGLIAINAGKDKGVQAGFSFDIYRDGIYKGKAVVNTVQDSYCSARVTIRVPGTTIQKGDQATTNL